MLMQFKIPADRHSIFDEHAFDKSIGKKVKTDNFGLATIKKVQVIDEGKAVLITIDTAKRIQTERGNYMG